MPKRIPVFLVERIRTTVRGRNALFHLFELWVGLAGIVSGAVFFVLPSESIDQTALAAVVGYDLASVWVIGYLISGVLIWWGLLRPTPRWEAAGLWLLGGATAANGIAVASVLGLRSVATVAIAFALTSASWLRAMLVYVDSIRLAEQQEQADNGAAAG